MLSLYKTLVRPHVEYCVSACNPRYIKDKLNRFREGLQKLLITWKERHTKKD